MQVIQYIPISQLKVHPNNPRLIKDDDFKKLCQSIKDNPAYFETRPILCNKQMVIFAGNMRYRAAKELGLKEVPVSIMDISEDKERELMIRDNVQNGEWDAQLLSAHYGNDELKNWGVDMAQFGVGGEDAPDDLTGGGSSGVSDGQPTMKLTFETPEALESAMAEVEAICKKHKATLSVSAGKI